MEYNQQLLNIDTRLKESNKKIEDLAYVIKSLTYSFQESGVSSLKPASLAKIESGIEKLSKAASAEYIDHFLHEIRNNLDERQKFLSTRITSLEDLTVQLGDFVGKKVSEIQLDTEIPKKLEGIKSDLKQITSEFASMQGNYAQIDSKIDEYMSRDSRIEDVASFIKELMPFLEKFYKNFEVSFSSVNEKFSALSGLISKFDTSEEIGILKTELDGLNITTNAVLSAVQLIDFKYKDIQDSFTKISTAKDINSVQINVNNVLERINALNEVLKLVSTSTDVELLKNELSAISDNMEKLQNNSVQLSVQNKEIIQDNISRLDSRLESMLSLLSDSKTGTVDISERVDEIYAKFDGFQEILLKLLALDNVDLVKKDIREVFVKIHSISEKLSNVANAKTSDEIKEETRILGSKLVELRDFINTAVLDNLKILAGDFGVVSEKVEQILLLERDDSKLIDLKKSVEIIDTNLRNTQRDLDQLANLSKLDEIIEKVDKFPENDDIYSIKEDLNFLVNQISKENDKTRGDLFTLQSNLNSFTEIALNFLKAEDLAIILDNIKESESNLKSDIAGISDRFIELTQTTKNLGLISESIRENENSLKSEIAGLGDRFLEFSVKANEANFEPINNELVAIKASQNESMLNLNDIKSLQSELNNKLSVVESDFKELSSSLNEENYAKITDVLNVFKESISGISDVSKESILAKIDELNKSATIITLLEDLKNQDLPAKISDLMLKVQEFDIEENPDKLEDLKLSILSGYRNSTEQVSQKIDSICEEINAVLNVNRDSLNDSFESLKASFQDIENELINASSASSNEDSSPIIVNEIELLKNAINIQLESIRTDVLAGYFENLSVELTQKEASLKQELLDAIATVGNVDNTEVLEAIASINNNDNQIILKEIKEDLSKFVINSIDMLVNKVDEIKQMNKDNNDILILKESLSQEINGLGDRLLEYEVKNTKVDLSIIKNNIQQVNENIKRNYSVSKNINDNINSLKGEIGSFKEGLGFENSEIKEGLDNVEKKISDLGSRFVSLTQSQNESKIETILNQYSKQLDSLARIEDVQELKDNCDQFGEQFVMQLMQLFENISFSEESEEIKSYIEDAREDLVARIQDIETSFDNEKLNSILVLFGELREKVLSVDESNQNITSLLEKFTNGPQGQDEFDYSLEDVQSDFAKMRLVLHDMTKAISGSYPDYDFADQIQNAAYNLDKISDILEDGSVPIEKPSELKEQIYNLQDHIAKLNTDIYDISLRTNKLILSSEDSNNELKNNLQTFKDVIEKVNPEKTYELFYEFSFSLQELKSEIEKIHIFSNSSYMTSKTIRDSLVHLGEWVDSAGVILEDVRSEVAVNKNSEIYDEVKKINFSIGELEAKIANLPLEEQYNVIEEFESTKEIISNEIIKIGDKFTRLETKVDEKFKAFEDKLNEMKPQPVVSRDEEIKPILEYIASQASAANENSKLNMQLLRRIENMEVKMSSFEQDIKKLVTFVEEE